MYTFRNLFWYFKKKCYSIVQTHISESWVFLMIRKADVQLISSLSVVGSVSGFLHVL